MEDCERFAGLHPEQKIASSMAMSLAVHHNWSSRRFASVYQLFPPMHSARTVCRFAWLLLLSQGRQEPRSRFLGCRQTCVLSNVCGSAFLLRDCTARDVFVFASCTAADVLRVSLCGIAQFGRFSWLCVFCRTLSPSDGTAAS